MKIDWDLILQDGLIITIVGYVIVFLALAVLYFVFTYLARFMAFYIRKKLERQGKPLRGGKKEEMLVDGDVGAAIAMALYLSTELHDEESNILTIQRVSKTYSPWSSKIYSIRGGYK